MLKARAMFCVCACGLFLSAGAALREAVPQEGERPFEAARLLALVAGNALPENIAAGVWRSSRARITRGCCSRLGRARG